MDDAMRFTSSVCRIRTRFHNENGAPDWCATIKRL
jgi:hypothetical protein